MLQLATIISQSSVCPTASVMEDLPSMSVTVKLFCFVFVATRRDTLQKTESESERTTREHRVKDERESERNWKKGERKKRERNNGSKLL